jgi:hypothetical protein
MKVTLGEGGGNNVIQHIIHLQTRIEDLAYNNNKMEHLIVITVALLLLIGTHHHHHLIVMTATDGVGSGIPMIRLETRTQISLGTHIQINLGTPLM